MKDSLQPEMGTSAEKETVIACLDQAVRAAGTGVSVSYLKDADVVRIRHKDGCSVCISAEGKSDGALLLETVIELKTFLVKSLCETKSYNEASNFSLRRLSQ